MEIVDILESVADNNAVGLCGEPPCQWEVDHHFELIGQTVLMTQRHIARAVTVPLCSPVSRLQVSFSFVFHRSPPVIIAEFVATSYHTGP